MIPARLSVVTLGARDVGVLREFYAGLGWPLAVDVDGFAAFQLRGAVLALFPLDELAADAQVGLEGGDAAPRGITLAVNVDERHEVDEAIDALRAAGARVTKEPVDAEWGGRSAYFADPEDNLWEVAWVPPGNEMAGALRRASGRPDVEDFIAAAERATNDYDLDAVASVYASHATLETVTDGAHEVHHGSAALRSAWDGMLGGLGARGLRLRKEVVAAAGDTIVNEWRGLGSHRRARGIEVWRRATSGEVLEHRLFTFLDTRPSDGPLARLRLFLAAPRIGAALLRAQQRARRRTG